MIDTILNWDYYLFELFNQRLTNPLFDSVMPWWREAETWIPLYLVLSIYLAFQYKMKSIILLGALIACVGAGDFISHHIIKKNVKRPRPCHQASPVVQDVHLLIKCGRGYSFTSNHATNHFALATFLIGTLGVRKKWIFWPLLFWAASIAYGQVYVGVHYPAAILCGAILGSLLGWLFSKSLSNYLYPKSIDA